MFFWGRFFFSHFFFQILKRFKIVFILFWIFFFFSWKDLWNYVINDFFSYPHLLESWKRSQNRTTNPDWILSFWRSQDLNLHGWCCHLCQFFAHSFSNSIKHCWTTRHDNIAVQVLSDINIAFSNWNECGFMNTLCFHTNQFWFEQDFWASESFISKCDHIPIRQFIWFVNRRWLLCLLHFFIKIKCNVTQLFFDISDREPPN